MLTARTKTDQVSGGLLSVFSSSLFEPYGIEDAEKFLSSVGSSLQTVRFDVEGEEVAVTARIKDPEILKRAVAKELVLTKPPEKFKNADLWRSADGELAIAIVENRIVIGETKSVERCLEARNQGESLVAVSKNSRLESSSAAIVTLGGESDPGAALITAVAERKSEKDALKQIYTTETRFNQNGIERRTVSDFGLIGMIIARLDPSN
ncbi:MAG: hypothetical protein HOP17_14120 [Acidobacteria bacterium]|nr:hypothetical protein [Acidobacteriota bacterium]